MRFAAACLICTLGSTAHSEIAAARYVDPTDIYGHGALPDSEYSSIAFDNGFDDQPTHRLINAVFEDTAPRLFDFDGDGTPEVLTVVSYFQSGAALRIYDELAYPSHPNGVAIIPVAESPPIGQKHRWLSVIGIADLDDDGLIEIAYIDRPHLDKALRIVEVVTHNRPWLIQFDRGVRGLTNHHLGDAEIEGGLRECDGRWEIVTADADWQSVIVSHMSGDGINSEYWGAYEGKESLYNALACG